MKDRIASILKEMSISGPDTPEHRREQLTLLFHSLIAEEQAKSAENLEQQTDTLIKLTCRLFYLTWVLVVLTAGLLVFTYVIVRQG